ncbi:MAG TPA: hypothetical protein VFT42_01950, partial [Solirubrobacteraceae bacterium]|nr:hypothetical protein [Solirubrobacteraceae bacterium]
RAGEALVAWEDRDGVHVAARASGRAPWRARLAAPSTGSPIGGVTAARDARGGWVVAERQFPANGSGMQDRVRTLVLAGDGRPALRAQDLGPGDFGIDARPVSALAPGDVGGATLVFETEGAPRTIEISADSHAGHFVPPLALPSPRPLADPWLASVPGGPTFVAATQIIRCGDVVCFGAPAVWAIMNGITPVRLGGPLLHHPGRAFGPSVAPIGVSDAALVFQLKTAAQAFSVLAPVRAAVIQGDQIVGGLQTLTSRPASEPVVLPLGEGRALAMWSDARGLGAALAGPNGHFYAVRAPVGPGPAPYHSNPTNRDARTSGDWVAATWQQGRRVRVSVRRFPPGANALKAGSGGV